MSNEKISELPAGAPAEPGDLIPIARAGANYALGVSDIQNYVSQTGISGFQIAGNTAGVSSLVSAGTIYLAGGNNVTLSQNSNSFTISANTAVGANLSVSAGSTSGAFGGITLSNSNNVSFGLNNGTITASASQSVQTQASGGIVGSGFTGTNVTGTLNSLGLALSVGAGGVTTGGAYLAGNTTGQSSSSTYAISGFNVSAAGLVSAGWSSNSLIISAPATTGLTQSIYATGNTTQGSSGTQSIGSLLIEGTGNVSVGYSNGSLVISGAQTTQTQASGSIAGIGVTTTTQAGSTLGATLSTNGLSLAMPPWITVGAGGNGVAVQVSNTTYTSGTVTFQNANGVTFGSSGANGISASFSQSVQTQASGNIGATGFATTTSAGSVIAGTNNTAGFTLGVPPYITTYVAQTTQTQATGAIAGTGFTSTTTAGALVVGTLNTAGISLGIPAYLTAAGGVQTAISGIVVSNTTYTSGTVTFQNANGISFGSSGANGISASYTVPTQSTQPVAASGSNGSSTFSTLSFGNLNGLSHYFSNGSMVGSYTVPTQTTQTQASGSIAGIGVTTTTQAGSTLGASLSTNGLSLAMPLWLTTQSVQTQASGAIAGTGFTGVNATGTLNTAGLSLSVGAGGGATTGGVYLAGNTTGQSSSSTYAISALNVSGAGLISAGWSSNSLIISAPGTTGITQSIYATGNTTQSSSGTQSFGSLLVNGAGNVSVGYSNGSMVISGGTASPSPIIISAGAASASLSSLVFSNSNGVSFGLNGSTITASAAGGGGGVAIAASNSTFTSGTVVLSAAGGALTISNGAQSALFSVPATSSLVGTGAVSLSTNGSTISIGVPNAYIASWYEPEVYGGTTSSQNVNGTVYIRPFELNNYLSINRLQILQQATSISATTASISASISGGNAVSGTGSWGQSGTVYLMSKQSTGSAAQSSNIISFASATYSLGFGHSASVSWSTNASTVTASYTTSQAASFVSQVDVSGNFTTGSFGLSGSSSFSSTSAAANTTSGSFIASFASAVMSQVRPIIIPFGTSLTPGEYWLAHIQSTNSGSTNFSLQRNCYISSPGIVAYTTNVSGYAEIGSTATIASSNYRWGIGSYNGSANMTTTIALSAISAQSNYSHYFNMLCESK